MEIRQWERGDAPEARLGYLRGVILQDRAFVFNGETVWIDDEVADRDHVPAADLFVEGPAPSAPAVAGEYVVGVGPGASGRRPRPLVRCADCARLASAADGSAYCARLSRRVPPDGFCHLGERAAPAARPGRPGAGGGGRGAATCPGIAPKAPLAPAEGRSRQDATTD